MDNLASLVAAIKVFPGVMFSCEFLDPAVLEHHSPTPKSDKPAVNGLVYSGWALKFVSHDARHCSHTPLRFRSCLAARAALRSCSLPSGDCLRLRIYSRVHSRFRASRCAGVNVFRFAMAAYSCPTATLRTSPQVRHRKVCSSRKDATLGTIWASVIGFPQVGHGGAGGGL